jgi:ABC-2 type transport system permease protein
MQAFLTLVRRELAAYFVSVTGYIIIGAAAFLMGWSFDVLLRGLQSDPTPMPLTEIFYDTLMFWIILLLLAPVITMRLFAQEKATGTFETLMTTPVSDLQVVLAKFTGAFIFFMVMWLPLLACLWIVLHFSGSSMGFDYGALGATFLGIFLLGAVFIAMGCLASAITRTQMVAAMVSLAAGFSLFMASFLPERVAPDSSGWREQLVSCFAFRDQMRDFARGAVDTRPIVFYLALTFFFLFLTLRVLEVRRWK